jgi:hypothetical protein
MRASSRNRLAAQSAVSVALTVTASKKRSSGARRRPSSAIAPAKSFGGQASGDLRLGGVESGGERCLLRFASAAPGLAPRS